MNHYSFIERYLSSIIRISPVMHSCIKYCYQSINYFLYNKKYQYKMNPLASIDTLDLQEANFFGYFDHTPWSNDMKFFILNVKNENSSLSLKLFEKVDEKYIFKQNIATSSTFNYQQGIRAVWISNHELVFNNIYKGSLCSSIYNIKDNRSYVCPFPIQEINPSKDILYSIDYFRLDILNKDYGYGLNKKNNKTDWDGIIAYNYNINRSLLLTTAFCAFLYPINPQIRRLFYK